MSLLLLFQGDSAGPISGTVSVTEADDTLAAMAALAIKATAAIAKAGDGLSASATLAIKGTLSASLANATVAALGTPALKGGAGMAEANDAASSSGALAIRGTLGSIEADDTVAAAGTTGGNAATVNATLANATASSSGQGAQAPIVVAHRGGSDDREDYERWFRDWQDNLRRTIDQAWRIADGEIDPVPLEPVLPADLGSLATALELIEQVRDQAVMDEFMAQEARLQEEEAIAVLLLAA